LKPQENLADGVLIAPFDCVLDRGISYYLIYRPQREQLPKNRAFREWLLAAALMT
jgi:LysR family glycine cleavage system transcriptional activator